MDVLEYKCPSCGAPITFDSSTQEMHCDSCGNSFAVETVREYNENLLTEDREDHYAWEDYNYESFNEGDLSHLHEYSCPSCGGVIVTEENTVASACPYCGNPAIILNNVKGLLKPDCIIPFKKDKKDAVKAFENFTSGKAFLPTLFKKENRLEAITGIYVPFWLFDCDTDGTVRYRGTRVRTWSDQNYRYTKTDHYSIHRKGQMSFEKIPVDSSKKMDDAYMEAIEPFDYSSIVEFDTAYLSGYFADKYDSDAEEMKPRANARIKRSLEGQLQRTVSGYASVTEESSNVSIRHGRVIYAVLPVWMCNTKYKDKIYNFSMNGQTGKFVGELPLDWGKLMTSFFGYFAAFSAVGIAITYFLGL
jgi:predicted RNA-binding Zn-ribbon protein involved in translation (DUF1610 family)